MVQLYSVYITCSFLCVNSLFIMASPRGDEEILTKPQNFRVEANDLHSHNDCHRILQILGADSSSLLYSAILRAVRAYLVWLYF